MAKPVITSAHINYGRLRIGAGTKSDKGNGDLIRSLGHIEGTDITTGDPSTINYLEHDYGITITAHAKKKVWKGFIYAYAQIGSPSRWVWNFFVVETKNDAVADLDDNAITITVTNPDTGTSDPLTPPAQVPPITLPVVP